MIRKRGFRKQGFSQGDKSWIRRILGEVYVISLPERKQGVLETLKKLDIVPNVYDAFLKKNINRDELIEIGFLSSRSKLRDAQIACHYSHIAVLKKFLKSKHETSLIFEDDIVSSLSPGDLQTELKKVMNNAKYLDYDIISLGRCFDICRPGSERVGNLVKVIYPRCMHAYIVNRKGAQKIIDLTVPLYDLPGDEVLPRAISNGLLNYYASEENLFLQNREDYGSTLGNGGALPKCS